MRLYFWLNREILKNKHFQYFDRSKTRHDRAKIGLAGQHDQPLFKNYFEPCKKYLQEATPKRKSLKKTSL